MVQGLQADESLSGARRMLTELVGQKVIADGAGCRSDAVLDASPLPSAIIAADGTVSLSNFEFGKLVGLGPDESANGRSLTSFDLFADRERLQAAVEAAMAGRRWDGGVSARTGRDQVSCDVVLTPIVTDSGNELLLTAYDRTDELRMQREAIAKEKLMTAGEIASGVAHEVNNPLAAIRIEAELIAAGASDDATRDSARVITREVDRASRIARTLIHITRRADSELREVQVNDLIQEILAARSRLDRWAAIELVTELDPELPAIVGPKTDLRQVFFSLITNAEDAVLNLDKAKVHVSTERVDNGVRVCVTDSGSGISADIRQRIFDPFFTTKDPDKGSGLGLSLSHGIVAEMGGKIWVEDAPLGGARFVVDLPLESQA